MRISKTGRYDHVRKWTADGFVSSVSEDPFGSRIELADKAKLIHGNDGIERGVDHRARSRVALSQRIFRSFPLGYIRRNPADRRYLPRTIFQRALD